MIELLTGLFPVTIYCCDADGSLVFSTNDQVIDTDKQQFLRLLIHHKRNSLLINKIEVVQEEGITYALFKIDGQILVFSNDRLVKDSEKFQLIFEESLPYIAQVAGGDAVLFNEQGVRYKAIHPDGTPNEEAEGRLNEMCRTVMQEWRPSLGPSSLAPGAMAVRIPLTPVLGLAFNNRFSAQQNQRLLNNARQYSYARYHLEDIIGEGVNIGKTKQLSREAAKSNSTILILGETGTGKELFAQAIHNLSRRAKKPFIAVNCGAIPAELVESTLFGYAGGSFTGSKGSGHLGAFEQANGGTVFFDEISEMPLQIQVKILRVLQEREVTRVGESQPRMVDVRIIASSNKPLSRMVEQGTFRADLFFRLKVLEIMIPPLRERKEDILGLVSFFLKKYSDIFGKPVYDISSEALSALIAYDWPGNVRELQNCFEYIFNALQNNAISVTVDHLPAGIVEKTLKNNTVLSLYDEHMNKTEHELIFRTMQLCGNNQKEAAKRLGVNRTTFWRLLKKHHLLREG
jgi:DNA-binding NtrC family response regulator